MVMQTKFAVIDVTPDYKFLSGVFSPTGVIGYMGPCLEKKYSIHNLEDCVNRTLLKQFIERNDIRIKIQVKSCHAPIGV